MTLIGLLNITILFLYISVKNDKETKYIHARVLMSCTTHERRILKSYGYRVIMQNSEAITLAN